MATVGYTFAGETTDGIDNFIEVGRFNSSAGAGDADTIHCAASKASGNLTAMAGVYSSVTDAPQDLLSSAVSLTVDSDDFTPVFESGAITWNGIADSTDYFIGMNGQSGMTSYFDTGTGIADMHFAARTHSNDLPDPYPSDTPIAREYSFYVTYTLSGGGGGIEILRRRIEGC